MAGLSDEDRENLVAYLDGELDEEAAQALEAKLNLDPEARAEADALRQAWGLLDYLPKAEPSPTFTDRTLERLTLEKQPARSTGKMTGPVRRRASWLAVGGWAAAALAAGAAGVGVGHLLGRGGADAAADEPMIRHLRVAEKWRYYEHVEDLDFLQQLAQPDLFGDDTGT